MYTLLQKTNEKNPDKQHILETELNEIIFKQQDYHQSILSTVDRLQKTLLKYEHPEYDLNNHTEEPFKTIEHYWDDNTGQDYTTEKI